MVVSGRGIPYRFVYFSFHEDLSDMTRMMLEVFSSNPYGKHHISVRYVSLLEGIRSSSDRKTQVSILMEYGTEHNLFRTDRCADLYDSPGMRVLSLYT